MKQHIYKDDNCSGQTLCGKKKLPMGGSGVPLKDAIQYDNSLGFAMGKDGWCCKCAAKARAIKTSVTHQLGVNV